MKRVLRLFLVFVIIFLLGGLIFFSANTGPVSTDTTIQNFVVNQGDGINMISQRLEKSGFVQNRYVFMILAYKMGLSSFLQAGLFRLSPSLSSEEIITKLSTGGSHDYWLKIIEGQRLAEIKPAFDISLEGYLFPDSYLIPQDYTADQIVEVINKNFQKKLTEAKVGATNPKLSDAEIITLASLLEREARTLKTKQEIAGILLNRLETGIALHVDSTVQYARDTRLKPKVYWTPIQKGDLEINSPFNTYHNPDLPPTPICNPGYNSIYAAFHPIASDYLYYITDTDGQMHYAKTLPEHNLNIAKYLK